MQPPGQNTNLTWLIPTLLDASCSCVLEEYTFRLGRPNTKRGIGKSRTMGPIIILCSSKSKYKNLCLMFCSDLRSSRGETYIFLTHQCPQGSDGIMHYKHISTDVEERRRIERKLWSLLFFATDLSLFVTNSSDWDGILRLTLRIPHMNQNSKEQKVVYRETSY